MQNSNINFTVLLVSKLMPNEHYSRHYDCYLDEGYRVNFKFDTQESDELVLSESISHHFGRENIGEFEFEPETRRGSCVFLTNPPEITTYAIPIQR